MTIRKKINKYVPEICTLLLYMIFMIIIMYFHEPWFDEAQAWLIARDASLKEILFVLPHYEGHPPIWHLILLPFAKLGAPFELSIKLVSLTFSSIAMGLFIFKAPFKRVVRLTIPFTYFFFYQYGVISRPYCILMLGFMLCSMFYKTKEVKPFRFMISLGILCSASAYGIILSAGIAIVWLIEIFYMDFSLISIKRFFCDKRFFVLLILLIYNLVLVAAIIPESDTYAIKNVVKNNEYVSRFIYMFFVLPGDATYLDICNYFMPDLKLNIYSVLGIVGSGIISIVFIMFAKRNNKILLLLVPYSFVGIFSTYVYFSPHHIGIITLFFLFILWCCTENNKGEGIIYEYLNKLVKNDSDIYLIKYAPKALFGIVICVSIIWSIGSSINEIFTQYGEGRNLARFIKENDIEEYNIMVQWKNYTNNETKQTVIDTNYIGNISALPYFKQNIYYNLNNNIPNKSFLTHKITNNEKNIEEWKKFGLPDVIIGDIQLVNIFGNSLKHSDYICVHDVKGSYIWKSTVFDYDTLVYIRKDLAKDFPNLKEIEPYKLIE